MTNRVSCHCEERASRVCNGQGEEPCREGTFNASEVKNNLDEAIQCLFIY